MSRQPTWEDADLILRLNELEARPETEKAFTWFRNHQASLVSLPEAEFHRDAPEFAYCQRIVVFYELVGVFVKIGMLSKEVVLEFWNVYDPWRVFRATIQKEREVIGDFWGENFEWLALQDEHWRSVRHPDSLPEKPKKTH